jgi:rfaE bifunctional protein kinase chain/domain
MNKELSSIVERFTNQNILVVGDLMLDRFVWSNVERISQEAPVPIAHVTHTTQALGGAANVAHNLAALGVHVELIGQVGSDADGELLRQELAKAGILHEHIMTNDRVPTIVKTRVMSGSHHLLRIDSEKIEELPSEQEAKLLSALKKRLPQYPVLIFSDYAKGFISENLAQAIIAEADKLGVLVLSDPTPKTFYKFTHSYLVKPNRREAEAMAGMDAGEHLEHLQEVGQIVKDRLEVAELIITLGKDGLAIFNENGSYEQVPTIAKEVYEVTGAGDTTIAAIAASLAAGATLHQAATIGNLCAGVAVAKLGTCLCSQTELVHAIKNLHE